MLTPHRTSLSLSLSLSLPLSLLRLSVCLSIKVVTIGEVTAEVAVATEEDMEEVVAGMVEVLEGTGDPELTMGNK